MGRSTPILRPDPSRRESPDGLAAATMLPPLRNGSSSDRQLPEEQSQSKPNSNLWKLMSVASED